MVLLCIWCALHAIHCVHAIDLCAIHGVCDSMVCVHDSLCACDSVCDHIIIRLLMNAIILFEYFFPFAWLTDLFSNSKPL